MEHSAEKDVPVDLVLAMVRLTETFGFTLPWANLAEACEGLASHDQLRWAIEDLTEDGEIEATPRGLRLALTEPPTRNLPPAE